MKRFFISLFLYIATSFVAFSQTPTITINTSATFFSLIIEGPSNILIDFGNGTTVEGIFSIYETSGSDTRGTIKIYGSGISYLDISSKSVTAIDISNATSLKTLRCPNNKITDLNTTNNNALVELWCYGNKITSLDVTKNTALNWLWCNKNQLTSLDVSKNTLLTKLQCDNNKLSSLDISKNTKLKLLSCASNQITSLDLSNNTALTSVDCYSNWLTFCTLPVKESTWTTYTFCPQNKVVLPNKNYILSENIDLSSQLSVNGNTTSYVWKTKGDVILTEGTDYSIANGVTTFLKVQTDSVYCKMNNATFRDLTLNTTNIKITQFHTDINEISLNAKLYPNPIKDYLNIECKENIVKVEIYSITGTKLLEKIGSNTESMNIPTGDLPKGMLIVKVYCKNGIIEKKVIKE